MQTMYMINNRFYSNEDVSLSTMQRFGLKSFSEMPLKFYKYFPNAKSQSTGLNHSMEALENNTVYLQSPVSFDDPYDSTITLDKEEFSRRIIYHYALQCGFIYQEEWEYNRIIFEFSSFLHDRMLAGERLTDQFMKNSPSDEKLRIISEHFGLALENALIKYQDRQDAWQWAFTEALDMEYNHVMEFLVAKFRISCFTTSPFSMLMWSHYANSHKGFCIEYTVPRDLTTSSQIVNNIFPVIYSQVRVSVLEQCVDFSLTPRLSDSALWEIYKNGLLTKSMDWSYQNEWRLISYDSLLSDSGEYKCRFFPISKIYLGNKMDRENRLRIIDICKAKNIPYSGVTIENNRYAMNECPILCEACPKLLFSAV